MPMTVDLDAPMAVMVSVAVAVPEDLNVDVNVDIDIDEDLYTVTRALAFDRISVRGSWSGREPQLKYEREYEPQRCRGHDRDHDRGRESRHVCDRGPDREC
jgi:hypothetical protein